MSKNNVYPYKVLPLPYEVDAIEPVVSSKTMKLHHDGLYKDYVIKLNQEILKEPALGNYLLEEILFNPTVIEEKHKDKVLTNAGGIYNHELYFNILTPKRDSKMSQLLKQALIKKHHTVEAFYLAITTECLSHQNYDWVFLGTDSAGEIDIIGTFKNNTTVPLNYYPILTIDLMEHSYYLDYGPNKLQYVKNILSIINWDIVSERYESVLVK